VGSKQGIDSLVTIHKQPVPSRCVATGGRSTIERAAAGIKKPGGDGLGCERLIMASDENSGELTPAARRRLQKLYEHACKLVQNENHEYATELLTQCVLGDPMNCEYLEKFMENLRKKYKNNKKGAPLGQLSSMGLRGAVKKGVSKKEWDEVLKNGLAVLKVNPWDVPTLTAMATACEGKMYFDPELYFLKYARDTVPKDPDVNRLCAIALGKRGQFDQAIVCWHVVEQARPDDEEPRRSIATLTVERARGKMDGGAPRAGGGQQIEQQLSPIDKLRQKIEHEPMAVANYFELSQLYINEDRFQEAEELLGQAYEVSGGNVDVREKWEDAQIRSLRHQLVQAGDALKRKPTPEAEQELKRVRKKLAEQELKTWKNRCERYPNNLEYKYQLAVRCRAAGNIEEAIKEFQMARNDPRRKGVCMLELGRCFVKIKQYGLAMRHFQSAIEDIPDRDGENKKESFYLAGKLAMALKEREMAEKYLNTLAGMDFSYKDVSALLDKLEKWRHDEESGANKERKSEAEGGDARDEGS
jgi:tetratricopeptide (TPR) repeat protein